MDFTLKKYRQMLVALQSVGYVFHPYRDYPEHCKEDKYILLRHDVDKLPGNSLKTAKIEAELGIECTYYFRVVPESLDVEVLKQIAALGHEIGYHYEALTTCKGDIDAAYQDFCKNLDMLRTLAPIKSICMHGSPRSPYDSKDIWKKYSYRELGIIGEPYLDTDFSQVFYLTDTGRRWDGYRVSVRDKIEKWQDEWVKEGLVFHTTGDVISAAMSGRLPNKVMITTHPQRWTDSFGRWLWELMVQEGKNVVKGWKVNAIQNSGLEVNGKTSFGI
jgi:hypothetical protein